MKYILPGIILIMIGYVLLKPNGLKVIDGDTYVIEGQRIRLLGVDCPELKQPYGKTAKKNVYNLLKSGKVTVQRKDKDSYGRWLSVVYINNLRLDSLIVTRGWGWADTYNHINEHLMYQATTNRRGLWNSLHPVEPYKFRSNK